MTLKEPDVSLVIVPRERFSFAMRSLKSILESTQYPFRLIYVDGGSPAPIQSEIQRAGREHGFDVVRRDEYLTPNQARNIGFERVTTPYVVFVDNDVVVTPNWLERLVRCAKETKAGLVGPLYLIGNPEEREIHMAGGRAGIRASNGDRTMYEEHRFESRTMDEVMEQLQREPTDVVEFHCMLARSDVLRRCGPLDEELYSACEHLDLSLLVREAGHEIFLEPTSVVTYLTADSFQPLDLPFYHLRWSDEWNRRSMARLKEKWRINDQFPDMMLRWLTAHRNAAPPLTEGGPA